MKELKENATTGIYIFENPEDFLKAIEYLQECYLASNTDEVDKNEKKINL